MFYAACERLASEYPEMHSEIESLDKLLAQNSGNLVTLDLLRTHIETTDAVLEMLFEALCADGDLANETTLHCPEHDQNFAIDGTCDLCDTGSLTENLQEVIAIRPPVLEPMPQESGVDQPRTDSGSIRVLISYSHDSTEHAGRVLALSDQLRAHGIDCCIDQYSPAPDEGWPHWMEREIERADFVVCLCSEEYCLRFSEETQADVGKGVAWEANLIRNAIYQTKPGTNSKFHPIQFDQCEFDFVPPPLQGKTVFTLHHFSFEDEGYESLYRLLTRQPATEKKPLGNVVTLEGKPRRSAGAPERITPAEAVKHPKTLPTTQLESSDSKVSQSDQEKRICQGWKSKLLIYQEAESSEFDSVRLAEIRQRIAEAKAKITEHCTSTGIQNERLPIKIDDDVLVDEDSEPNPLVPWWALYAAAFVVVLLAIIAYAIGASPIQRVLTALAPALVCFGLLRSSAKITLKGGEFGGAAALFLAVYWLAGDNAGKELHPVQGTIYLDGLPVKVASVVLLDSFRKDDMDLIDEADRGQFRFDNAASNGQMIGLQIEIKQPRHFKPYVLRFEHEDSESKKKIELTSDGLEDATQENDVNLKPPANWSDVFSSDAPIDGLEVDSFAGFLTKLSDMPEADVRELNDRWLVARAVVRSVRRDSLELIPELDEPDAETIGPNYLRLSVGILAKKDFPSATARSTVHFIAKLKDIGWSKVPTGKYFTVELAEGVKLSRDEARQLDHFLTNRASE